MEEKICKEEYLRYGKEFWNIYKKDKDLGYFPEWLLQNVDTNWMSEIPLPEESAFYLVNIQYCEKLKTGLGKTRGINFEILAQYLLSCIPGCKVQRRVRARNTEYDLLCTLQGSFFDFRSELSRYFVCECKDWKKVVGVTTVYKFFRVIKAAKSNFGILFSKKDISGRDKFENSYREIIKIYQSDGIAIVVINNEDIDQVINGNNFITLLKNRYEKVRLDLV